MKFTAVITTAFLFTSAVFAHPSPDADYEANYSLISRAIGSSCKAPEGTGKCGKASTCGGITYNNLCPNDPADVKCCLELTCKPSSGGSGLCRSKSRNGCSGGTFVAGACPGSADIACCVKGGSTSPNPPSTGPKIPANKCKSYVIDNGYKILKQFPGLVHTVWCYANKPGEHGKGRALDFMVKPHAAGGRTLAEWTMKNHKSLNVMYVIWEQRIWNPSRDKQGPWTGWRKMENRGSCTANHCDHVHVSFN
ncbi:hypothetical protein FPQ18DRAFT_404552 [Pyronema domesticum]|uniref:ARB-07466-like C-terminal domain-containing protein n=1 Tax=Pyronema omphalodes (strain CBS 100304) TaxID=1076935 RepID=U4LAI5_PYROM|nr:hypothetical protein FPQ18DRAFT_404552 [Pyronema domesticum]CCX15947.1 Similar to hypothetical protein TEQG_07413 [Trichophyton equinum CBS 127.97]; acc. no. EGE08431 [Pyronema omphalodes CBS 100304]